MGVIDNAVQWATDIANDDSHGYSQSVRWGPHYYFDIAQSIFFVLLLL